MRERASEFYGGFYGGPRYSFFFFSFFFLARNDRACALGFCIITLAAQYKLGLDTFNRGRGL